MSYKGLKYFDETFKLDHHHSKNEQPLILRKEKKPSSQNLVFKYFFIEIVSKQIGTKKKTKNLIRLIT